VDGSVSSSQGTGALTIYRNTGGFFDAPPVTNAVAVGTGTISFTSCTQGTFTYSFYSGVEEVGGMSGSIALTRLLASVSCTPGGSPSPDFYMSGNWFKAATSGQGFILELNPNQPYLFATWYTYERQAGSSAGLHGQRWFTIQASYVANSLPRVYQNLPIFETRGGSFNSPPGAGQVTTQVGTATLAVNCTAATLTYHFTSGGMLGLPDAAINSVRVGPPPAGCQ
jgi:hypothetical protein